LLLALAAVPAYGKELTVDELRAIQGKMKSTDQLSVDFTQGNYQKLRNKEVKREGHAIFQKPNKFKWVLMKPVEQAVIFDGKDVYEYNAESKSASRFSPTGSHSYELKQIVDLVLNFDSLLKRYDLIKADQDGDIVKIQLKPKQAQDITDIDLSFSVKDSLITFLKLSLKNGNALSHDFRNAQRGALAADTFKLPKGVKITDSN
jgi:outer membrane lipoprotein-sorting protein